VAKSTSAPRARGALASARTVCAVAMRRVAGFGLFKDTSELRFGDVPISLNVQCIKA
jgi:hypothetical protein